MINIYIDALVYCILPFRLLVRRCAAAYDTSYAQGDAGKDGKIKEGSCRASCVSKLACGL